MKKGTIFFNLLFVLVLFLVTDSKSIAQTDLLFNKTNNSILNDPLPDDFPPYTISNLGTPSPGAVFFPGSGKGYGNYLIVTDSVGNLLKYKKLSAGVSNFSVQPNGMLVFNQSQKYFFKAYSEAKAYITDTSLNVVDSIVSANGFKPSPHCAMILPNGHYVYTSFEPHNVDMSKVVAKGNPNAVVAGAVLVELDINKNVVFQWRSWDHIPITDTYQPINDFLNVTTLYSNFNSVDIDFDGNFLLCNRLLSEITKINRKTGQIIWRLGGKNNQFEFINEDISKDPVYFSMQHDIRVLPNGNVTLFDNGEQYNTQSSRAVEYVLDENNLTATKVWEYKPEPLIFAGNAGSMQRLSNGNTFIGWGGTASAPKRDITEVNDNGVKQFELSLPTGYTTFKALKFPYPIGLKKASVTIDEIKHLNHYTFDKNSVITGVEMEFSELDAFMYNSVTVEKYDYAPVYPKFNISAPFVLPYKFWIEPYKIDGFKAEVRFRVEELPLMKNTTNFYCFVRDTLNKGYFTQLPTTFDQANNELVVQTTKFGEFIFGRIDAEVAPQKPLLISPADEEKLNNKAANVTFKWTPMGYFEASRILVSDISDFSNIIVDSTLVPNSLVLSGFESGKTYYWKVACKSNTLSGEFSNPYQFEITEPFISIINPNGGEILSNDSTRKFINWEKNITEMVKIDLYRNNEFVMTIKDSLLSYTGAFAWIIPSTITADTTYKIKITNIANADISTISENNFTITEYTTVEDTEITEQNIEITNYPNPVTNSTTFEFTIKNAGRTRIKIYDLMGEWQEIYNEYNEAGQYRFNWIPKNFISGVYFYEISVGNQSVIKKIILTN